MVRAAAGERRLERQRLAVLGQAALDLGDRRAGQRRERALVRLVFGDAGEAGEIDDDAVAGVVQRRLRLPATGRTRVVSPMPGAA